MAAERMAAKLKIMSARAVKAPVSALAASFSNTQGCEFDFEFAPVGTIEDKLAAEETADVIILSQPAIGKLAASGRVIADSVRALGRMSIGVAVREGAAVPRISTPEAFRALLVSALAISVSDPSIGGTSAVYLPKLFERLGLTAALEPKLRRQKGGGGDVAACVARGEAEIGITFISELLSVPGVTIAGPLPPAYSNDTTYWAAISSGGSVEREARAFISALLAPGGRAAWLEAGFAVEGG